MDKEFLDASSNLKAVFYGAGSIKGIVTDEFWNSNIIISAFAANAVPVAEYTLSQILFSLRLGWKYVTYIKDNKKYPEDTFLPRNVIPGNFKSTVGVISLGMIGKRVCNLLKPFDLNVIA